MFGLVKPGRDAEEGQQRSEILGRGIRMLELIISANSVEMVAS
jgi:hypothetical protein